MDARSAQLWGGEIAPCELVESKLCFRRFQNPFREPLTL